MIISDRIRARAQEVQVKAALNVFLKALGGLAGPAPVWQPIDPAAGRTARLEAKVFDPAEARGLHGRWAAIPAGHVRLFHYTSTENVDSIRQHGLLESHAHGDGGLGAGNEPSAGVWASSYMPKMDAHAKRAVVEFHAHPDEISQRAEHPQSSLAGNQLLDEWQQGHHHVIMKGDVKPSQIVAIHEPWHSAYDYMKQSSDPMSEYQWIEGDNDPSLDPYRKAYEVLKQETTDYRGLHTAPNKNDAPIHDLTQNGVYPDDVYTNPHFYIHDEAHDPYGMQVAQQVRGNPEADVTIYRSVPHGVRQINPGDWVAVHPAYARQHGLHPTDPEKDLPVISATVKAKHLYTDGNSISEYGYHGPIVETQEGKKFDPAELRDDHGRWSAFGAARSALGKTKYTHIETTGTGVHRSEKDVVHEHVSNAELKRAQKQAIAKAKAIPQPTPIEIADNKARIAAGGEAFRNLRGNNLDRDNRNWAVYVEFGGVDAKGKDKGYVPCVYCGCKMSWHNKGKLPMFEQDKIITTNLGGKYRTNNIVPACSGCNKLRSDKPMHEGTGLKAAKPAWYTPAFIASVLKTKPKRGTERGATASQRVAFPKPVPPGIMGPPQKR